MFMYLHFLFYNPIPMGTLQVSQNVIQKFTSLAYAHLKLHQHITNLSLFSFLSTMCWELEAEAHTHLHRSNFDNANLPRPTGVHILKVVGTFSLVHHFIYMTIYVIMLHFTPLDRCSVYNLLCFLFNMFLIVYFIHVPSEKQSCDCLFRIIN